MSDGIVAFGYRISIDKESAASMLFVLVFAAMAVGVPLVAGWVVFGFDIPHYAGLYAVWVVGFMVTAVMIGSIYVVYLFVDDIFIIEEVGDE